MHENSTVDNNKKIEVEGMRASACKSMHKKKLYQALLYTAEMNGIIKRKSSIIKSFLYRKNNEDGTRDRERDILSLDCGKKIQHFVNFCQFCFFLLGGDGSSFFG